MFIELIDNTDLGHGLDRGNVINNNNQMRLMVPNEGRVEGRKIHFFSEGLKRINGKFWLDRKNIFLEDGELQKRGLVVHKHTVCARDENVEYEETSFFKVHQSNVDDIMAGYIVIVNARTAYRFNRNKHEYFFVNPENVFLIFSGTKMIAGPNFVLLENDRDENSGISEDGKRYYFDDSDYEIEYDSKQYHVVNKKNLALVE